jgi:hypothetical protein
MTQAGDPFSRSFAQRRRRRFVELAETLSIGTSVVAVFAWLTSLDILRQTAVIGLVLAVACIGLGLIWRVAQRDLGATLARSAGATAAATALVWLGFSLPGLGLGFERRITELPAAQVRMADIEARQHPRQETILALLAAAREAPSMATLRPLVPFLHNQHLFLTDAEGRSRPVSVAVREALLANPKLLKRSLHEEAVSMAALLPLDGPVPPQVEVDVASRLRNALGLLLELHVEHRMQRRFDLPTVSVVLDTVVPHPEHGGRELRHEIGLTYPFADFAARQDAVVNYASLRALLAMVEADLDY